MVADARDELNDLVTERIAPPGSRIHDVVDHHSGASEIERSAPPASWGRSAGSRRSRRAALVAVAALCSVSGVAHAGAPGELLVSVGGGYRHSFTLDQGGFALSAGIGGFLGPFGVEYQLQLSNDHSFSHLDQRHAARTTNWFNVMLRYQVNEHVDLGLAFGPGLGWVKNAGPSYEVGGRFPSQGIHEELRLGLNTTEADDFVVGVRLRVGVEHMWQYAIVSSPELALTGGLEIYLGPKTR